MPRPRSLWRASTTTQGESGFFVQVVRFLAGFETPPHSHDRSEVFVVLEGGCVVDGQVMHTRDSNVVEAATRNTASPPGPDGVTLLIVRNGAATANL